MSTFKHVTKKEFINDLAKNNDFTKESCVEYYDAFIRELKNYLLSGRSVWLQDFGIFEVKKFKERTARDVQAGKPIVIPARLALTYKPTDKFRQEVAESER